MTRLNVVFFSGNAILFAFELANPFFGFWHALSLLSSITASVIYGGMLHYYSSRFVSDIFLKSNGKQIRVKLLNAFFMPQEKTLQIVDCGYLLPSRLYNVDNFTNKRDKLYINWKRNMHSAEPYNSTLEKILKGAEIDLSITKRNKVN